LFEEKIQLIVLEYDQDDDDLVDIKSKNMVTCRLNTWKLKCLEILNSILDNRDSLPFRLLDPIKNPGYYRNNSNPIDLITVKD